MHLPLFPTFKKIELHDKDIIERHTEKYKPYSDFNFVSLWSWNLEDQIEFCFLNDNLVLKLTDYVDNTPFLTFLGNKKIIDTLEQLFSFSETAGLGNKLKLLPSDNFNNLQLGNEFILEEDVDNFDYILDVAKISTMKGQVLKHKRKLLNSFLKNYGNDVKVNYMNLPEIKKHLISFYHHWSKSKNQHDLNINELHAIQKLLKHYHFFNTIVMSVHHKDKLIGFTLFEEISKDWALSSFQKGDISYRGIYEFLNHNLAKHLNEKNIKFVNIEQDLGISGLRRAKLDYNPSFLKKFTLKKVS